MGRYETTTAEEDAAALEKLKPRSYKSMEDPNFLKCTYKHLYEDPLETIKAVFEKMLTDFFLG